MNLMYSEEQATVDFIKSWCIYHKDWGYKDSEKKKKNLDQDGDINNKDNDHP